MFRFDNERDNKFHYEKYAVDLNEYCILSRLNDVAAEP